MLRCTKQLQAMVHKVAKKCGKMKEKLNLIEMRTSMVEADVEALKEHEEAQGEQLSDVVWKLEDYENHQRKASCDS
ncbi:hypothetical protein NDU88_005367 [Pleurodeles waltl]|uniref:Uncharacterized protein n=1 Tax=Pleurodeles waltl TaxID=8319 RepID=A0AAV7VIU6_PLEWA|nr:hypothetical protein NDU88_005367 [Pleurodeles waltl]